MGGCTLIMWIINVTNVRRRPAIRRRRGGRRPQMIADGAHIARRRVGASWRSVPVDGLRRVPGAGAGAGQARADPIGLPVVARGHRARRGDQRRQRRRTMADWQRPLLDRRRDRAMHARVAPATCIAKRYDDVLARLLRAQAAIRRATAAGVPRDRTS
jgi:hypothetical protein